MERRLPEQACVRIGDLPGREGRAGGEGEESFRGFRGLIRRKYAYAPPKRLIERASTSISSSKMYAPTGYGYVLFILVRGKKLDMYYLYPWEGKE